MISWGFNTRQIIATQDNAVERMDGKYSIELFRDGGEGAGIEKILIRHDSLNVARTLYKVAALNCSERLIMLCDRARVLARSDRPETMPENKIAAPLSRYAAFSQPRCDPMQHRTPHCKLSMCRLS